MCFLSDLHNNMEESHADNPIFCMAEYDLSWLVRNYRALETAYRGLQ